MSGCVRPPKIGLKCRFRCGISHRWGFNATGIVVCPGAAVKSTADDSRRCGVLCRCRRRNFLQIRRCGKTTTGRAGDRFPARDLPSACSHVRPPRHETERTRPFTPPLLKSAAVSYSKKSGRKGQKQGGSTRNRRFLQGDHTPIRIFTTPKTHERRPGSWRPTVDRVSSIVGAENPLY
jgi:hypothetical protein